jgi:hypothetical protein
MITKMIYQHCSHKIRLSKNLQKLTNQSFTYAKNLNRNSLKTFSTLTTSGSETELRPKIDPLKKQLTDFLKNVSQYEESVEDTLNPYYFEG